MAATIKIIPYGAPVSGVLAAAEHMADTLHLHPFAAPKSDLILTEVPGQAKTLTAKAQKLIAARLASLGGALASVQIVAHQQDALLAAIRNTTAPWVLILPGSATSDKDDLAPAALVKAGGRLIRFGMPVDPGNLLFLGQLGDRHVVGLPGCARSPALNGADFVLQRLAASVPVDDRMIAEMGVGGLLKEIPNRPQARSSQALPDQPRVAVLILAAGAGRRMGGVDKLCEDIGGVPLLRHVAQQARASDASEVIVMLPDLNHPRAQTLGGLDVASHAAPSHPEGMAGSLRDGLSQLPSDCDAVIIALADMPDVTAAHYNALIAAFDPGEGREICRASTALGQPGHPVLFARRFFESLGALSGDVGAKQLIATAREFLVDVPTAGQAALTDLDTPDDWAKWRQR